MSTLAAECNTTETSLSRVVTLEDYSLPKKA